MAYYIEGDGENLPRLERLRALSGGESSLAVFLKGFQDGGFKADLQRFVVEHAPAFRVACVDGSYPLDWTRYHSEYRQMYESHFEAIVQSVSMSKDEVAEYFKWLHDSAQCLDDDSEDLYAFIEALTSSESFDEFLQVMFAEVRRQQEQQVTCEDAAPDHSKAFNVEEIEVTVPPGVSAGQVLQIQYLGLPYSVVVPPDHQVGMVFQTDITLRQKRPHEYVCTYCGVGIQKDGAEMRASKCKRCYERCRYDVCYCGVACQKADWPNHKISCGKLVDVSILM